MYPSLQMQLWEPLVLVQLALASQTSSLQSSIFVNTIDLQRVTELREKILTSLLDNEAIICGEQLFPFFVSLI